MGQNRLQFAAMSFFVLGFILAGSGWSLVISMNMQGRPEWSVCGQDMCSCLPSTTITPYCPLCVVSDKQSTNQSCDNSESSPTDTPTRIPKNARFEAASTASQAGCASIFLSFVFGTRHSGNLDHKDSAGHLITQDSIPLDPIADLPTPPPRA